MPLCHARTYRSNLGRLALRQSCRSETAICTRIAVFEVGTYLAAMSDPVRRKIEQLAETQQRSLAEASLAIGRNAAWLQQYLRRGTPRILPEDDRLKLAQLFSVNERELGARDPWRPE